MRAGVGMFLNAVGNWFADVLVIYVVIFVSLHIIT